ncbi:MAG: agmatinase [Proteobacteria bacterium]|nr:agmatinase [Pseudomonadota bacterium]MBU1737009.1 agmatinase [Pseudomonadota bacterium]
MNTFQIEGRQLDRKSVVAGTSLYHKAHPTSSLVPGVLNLVGAAFDGTACFRKGASAGPLGIREVSEDIETYSPYQDSDLEEISPFYDLGDLALVRTGDADADWSELKGSFNDLTASMDGTVRILALGGEHSVSYFFIEKYLSLFPDLVLLHLDAHADLRDGYQGYRYSHASVIRRCLDHFGPMHRLAQFGIRSGTREEFAWMRKEGTLYGDLLDFINYMVKIPADRPVYLTLDLDFFDPAFMPGTGTPEAGGEDFHSFIEIVRVLRAKRVVGADVVELAPAIDPTGNSGVFAAKVVREIILAFHGENGHVR